MKDLISKRNALLKQFEQHSEFVRGSITSVCATCNRARCICEKKTAGKAYRLTYKDAQQKTRIVHVTRNRLPRITKMTANYAKLRKILEKLLETNIAIFKTETRS